MLFNLDDIVATGSVLREWLNKRVELVGMGISRYLADYWPVLLILVVGLGLRLYFLVGLVGGHPQDDSIYVGLSESIVNGDSGLGHYANLPAGYVADPVEWFQFRVALTYPMALVFSLFGEGDLAAATVPMLSSLAAIILVFCIGRHCFDRTTGLLAAWLLALLPVDILLSTRVLTDVTLSGFFAAGTFCVLVAEKRGQRRWWFVAGLCFGFAYLTKIFALPVTALLSPAILWIAWRRRQFSWPVYFVAGLLVVLLAEGLTYRHTTGDFFLHSHIVRSASENKYTTETFSVLPLTRQVSMTYEGEYNFYTRFLLGFEKGDGNQFTGFGYHPWVWLLGFCLVLWQRRYSAFLIAFAFTGLFVLLEVVPMHFMVRDHILMLGMLCRSIRFVAYLCPLGCVFAAYVFVTLGRKSFVLGAGALAVVVASGAPELLRDYDILHGSMQDMRLATRIVSTTDLKVYTDGYAMKLLTFYHSKIDPSQLVNIEAITSPDEIKDGLVILGGCRSIELMTGVVTDALAPWSRKLEAGEGPLPAGWQELARFASFHSEVRLHDMRIFLVRSTPAVSPVAPVSSDIHAP